MELTKTGIPGLDELLGGGIPAGWTTILSGAPGCGKTCLSVGYLVEGINKYDESGIFCSFNESRKELFLTQQSFGYDLEKLEKTGKLKILDFSYGRALGEGQLALQQTKVDLPALTKSIKESINEINAKRLVIDPLTIISLLFDNIREVRYNFLRFFDVIRRFGVTSLAITESSYSKEFTVEEFLAAGIIRLYNERLGSKRQRGIEIVKMRGINHKRGLFPLSITSQGIIISPEVEMLSG
ncbi:MAG: RAD55 family ATPase [Candidatus Hodarchaeales archaeon]|jgi:circadian clock protein KaiC